MDYKKIFFRTCCSLGVFVVIFITTTFLYSKVQKNHYINLEPLQEITTDTWYKNNRVVVHATGGIDGLSYTNSKEALLNSINSNMKVIEVDFNYTSDNHLVCYHKSRDILVNEEKFTLEEFKNIKIKGRYTPMEFQDIVDIMKDNPNIYISVDVKSDSLVDVVKDIVNQCTDEDILNRLIIQCFYPGEKEQIKEIYNFPDDNFLFASYKYSLDPYKIMKVCYEEGFNVVVANMNSMPKEVLELFKSKNIYVYLYTVNRLDEAEHLIKRGAYGIYTDFLFDFEPA